MADPIRAGQAIGYCEYCCKLQYMSRKMARHIARQHRPRKGVYPCPVNELLWHVGEVPGMVKQGVLTRTEYYDHGETA
jgi:hypothetical protein